jgi:hypothetical protein
MVALADEVVEVSDKGTVLSKKGWEDLGSGKSGLVEDSSSSWWARRPAR